MPNEKANFLEVKIKGCALSSFKLYNEKGTISSLKKDEISALKTLKIRNWLCKSHESDKDNSILLIK